MSVLKYKKMAIYELRQLARELGMENPSCLTRIELEREIRKKKVINDEMPGYLTLLESGTVVGVGDAVTSVESPNTYESHVTFGFVHLLKGHALFVSRDLFTYRVSMQLTVGHKLQMGDYIEAVVSIDKKTNSRTVVRINKVAHSKFFKEQGELPNKATSLWGKEVLLGSRILLPCDKASDKIRHISNSGGDNLYKMALLLDDTDESVHFLCKNGINEVFLVKVDMSIRKQVALCMYVMFKSRQMADEGRDVVLFVDSLSKLWRIFNKTTAKNELVSVNYVHVGAIADLKCCFMANKAFNKGSLTIVAYINKPVSEIDIHLYDEISDLANMIL